MSNSFILTAFGKHLASRDNITPRINNINNNNQETIIQQGTINPSDLPSNAKLLPLIHNHNGQPCPISERNQLKLKKAQEYLATCETTENNNILNFENQLSNEQRRLDGYIDDMERFRQQNDPRGMVNADGSTTSRFEQEFSTRLNQIDTKTNKIGNDVVNLLNNTDPPKIIKNKIPQRTKWDLNKLSQYKTDPQFAPQWLPVLEDQYKTEIRRIDNEIASLNRSQPQNGARKKEWDNKIANLTRERDNNIKELKNQTDLRKREITGKQGTLQREFEACNIAIRRKEDELQQARAKLDDDKNNNNNTNASVWAQRKSSADLEVKNANSKLDAFKNAANNELSALQSRNDEAVSNYRAKIDAECANLDKICADRIAEIKHNRKNTSIELNHGISTSIPINTNVRIELPVIKPVLVQTTEMFDMPQIQQVPISNNFYSIDGHIGDQYRHKELQLKEIPLGNTTITHSRSVPQIRAVREENVIMQDEVVTKAVPVTRMETKKERVVVPTTIVHAPIGSVEVPFNNTRSGTSSTTTTTKTTSTSTTKSA